MKKITIALLCLIFFACQNKQTPTADVAVKTSPKDSIVAVNKGDVAYADYFTAKTMRLDYYHNGSATLLGVSKMRYRPLLGL